MRIAKIAVAIVALATLCLAQQDKSKRPSPPGQAEVTLNGKQITIDYSRPKMADPKTHEKRLIMGKLVPYGEVWRLGANEATTLTTAADLDINGTAVPAGKYTLFALPEAEKWTLIVSKKTGEWGIPYPGEQEDFARIPMKVDKTSQVVDPFTISFDKRSNGEATLNCAWENTKVSVDVKAK
jgi:hypothetical protein